MIRTTISSPNELSIYDSKLHKETLHFLADITNRCINQSQWLTIDLRKLTYIDAAASLMLFAFVNRIQLVKKRKDIIRFIFPRKDADGLGHELVVQTGLSRALSASSLDKLEELVRDETYYQSSTSHSTHLAKTKKMLTKHVQITETQELMLTGAIGEAMLNVHHHAYDCAEYLHYPRLFGGNRWWQCAWFDPDRHSFVFIIYDVGQGIYCSYTGDKNIERNSSWPSKIEEAMTEGNSRYRVSGRGNGSEDIKRPILCSEDDAESLLVYSGMGAYHYTSGEEQPGVHMLDAFIPGTLVQWELQMKKKGGS